MKFLQNIKIVFARWIKRQNLQNSDAEKAADADRIRALVKCALDNYGWNHDFDEAENCFYGKISESGRKPVILTIKPRTNYIHAQCFAVQQPVAPLKLTDALLFCNNWNRKSLFPKAYIDTSNNYLIADTVMTLEKGVSEEFVRICLLKNLFVSNIAFFEEAAAENILPGGAQEKKSQEQ